MVENIKLLAALDDSDELLLLSLCKEDKCTFRGLQIDDLTDEQCRSLFRFTKADIESLCHALHIPEKIVCSNMTTVTGLCILLRRFAYPCCLEDLEAIFGRSMMEILYIIKEVLDYLHDHHCHLLSDLNRNCLSPRVLGAFCGCSFC